MSRATGSLVVWVAVAMASPGAAVSDDEKQGRTVLAGPENVSHVVVDAADFVDLDLLRGADYQVAREAYSDGFSIRFRIVTPWTSYEPVQDRLNEIARTATAAGITTTVAMGAVTKGSTVGMAVKGLGISSKMNKMLALNSAQRIRALNTERLEAIGIRDYEADAFQRNFNYTPMQQALVVEALEDMGPIAGREVLLAHATAVPDEALARFMVLRAQMVGRFVSQHPADIVSVGGLPWLLTRKGALVTTLPVDYLTWTPELSRGVVEAAERTSGMDYATREVWLEGTVDPGVRERLEAGGWTVRERVGLTPRNQPPATAPAEIG